MPSVTRPSDVKLAVSLVDLDRINPGVRPQLISTKLDLTKPIRVTDGSKVQMLFAFCVDLLTAATVLDVIRNEDWQVKRPITAAWVFRKTWQKLSSNDLLTSVENGVLSLNPEVFTGLVKVAVVPAQPTAPVVEGVVHIRKWGER